VGALVVPAAALVVLGVLTGCGSGAGASRAAAPVLLAQAQGICPMQVVYNVTLPPECRFSRFWNGFSPVFKTPRRQWGVAYAFNCGARAGDFSFDAIMQGMDHMGVQGPSLHARHGSGYVMVSRDRMMGLIRNVPAEYKMDSEQMAIQISSPCTWHVKALLGSRTAVASSVPAIPRMQGRWWK
jgi:hypothetical protein